MLGIGGAAVLILLIGLGSIVLLPLLSRADRTLDAIESALPVVEEQIGPDVSTLRREIPPTVDEMLTVLDAVQSHVENIDRKTGPVVPPAGPDSP